MMAQTRVSQGVARFAAQHALVVGTFDVAALVECHLDRGQFAVVIAEAHALLSFCANFNFYLATLGCVDQKVALHAHTRRSLKPKFQIVRAQILDHDLLRAWHAVNGELAREHKYLLPSFDSVAVWNETHLTERVQFVGRDVRLLKHTCEAQWLIGTRYLDLLIR